MVKRHWSVVWCLVVSALALAAAPSAAQDFEVPLEVSERLVEVRLADGTTVRGRIVSVDDDLVALVTAGGSRVEFSRDLERWWEVDGLVTTEQGLRVFREPHI